MSAQSSTVRVWLATLAVLSSGAAICPSACLAGKPNQPPPPPVQYAMTVVPQMRCVTGMNNVGDMTGGPTSKTAGTLLYTAQTGTVIDLSTIIQVPAGGKLEYVVDVNDPDVDGRQVAGRFSRRELDGTNRYHAFRCTIYYDASNNLKSDAFEELVLKSHSRPDRRHGHGRRRARGRRPDAGPVSIVREITVRSFRGVSFQLAMPRSAASWKLTPLISRTILRGLVTATIRTPGSVDVVRFR